MAEIWMDVKRSGLLLSSNLGCLGEWGGEDFNDLR